MLNLYTKNDPSGFGLADNIILPTKQVYFMILL